MRKLKNPIRLSDELRGHFFRRGCTTGTSISKATGVGQPQVFRNLFRQPKRVTQTLLRLCKYAKISAYEDAVDPTQSPELMIALAQVWDGTDAHARKLAKLLFAHHRAHT